MPDSLNVVGESETLAALNYLHLTTAIWKVDAQLSFHFRYGTAFYNID